MPEKASSRRETDYSRSHTTARLSKEVKDYITSRARYNESIDQTLRRIFGINGRKEKASAGKGGASR